MRCIALAAMVICASERARAEPACYANGWDDCIERVHKLEQDDVARKKRGHPTYARGLTDKWSHECIDDHHASSCVLAAIARTRGFGYSADNDVAVSYVWLACEFDEKVRDLAADALSNGQGVPHDPGAALQLLGKLEPEEVRYAAPNEYLVGDYERDCNAGDPEACAKAAALLDQGDGIDRDRERAYELFFIACDRDRSLCIDIAYAYKQGKKVGANKKYAKRFRKLALQREGDVGCRYGSTHKCVTNGHAFLNGKHVARDREYAVVLFEEACRAKDPDGCAGLAEAYWAKPKPGKGRKTAVELYRKACDDKSAGACWKLGRLYLRGEHVSQDTKRAERLFARACELGDQAGCKYMEKKP